MKVKIQGHGVINFPDSMSKDEVQSVLDQFKPKEDETVKKLLSSIEKLAVKSLTPTTVVQTKIVEVEKQVFIEKPVIKTIEIPSEREAVSYKFTIEREDEQISAIYAEPYDG